MMQFTGVGAMGRALSAPAWVRAAAAAAPVAVLGASPAPAQIEDVEPYHVVVTPPDGAKLWSGDDIIWYTIRPLPAGQVLVVDGESDRGWLRARYPAGTPAFVRVEEAEVLSERRVRMVRESFLRAYNENDPTYSGCYKSVFRDPVVEAGREFELRDRVMGVTGDLEGYVITAPPSARGYVFQRKVRDATEAEVQAHLAALREPAPRPESDQGGVAEPAGDVDAPAGLGDDLDALAPPVDPSEASSDPADMDAGGLDRPEPPRPPVRDEDKLLADLAQLGDSFEAVMDQPLLEAEFTPLIREYEALSASIDGGDVGAQAISDHIDVRLAALRVQRDIQAFRRDIAALRAETASAVEAAAEAEASADRVRDYLSVGRLLPSAVYAGDRLPRLYRVVAVGAERGGRTLAYLLPEPGLGLEAKVGSIVGVAGGPSPAGGRRPIGVIDAVRVDVLEAGDPPPTPRG